MIFFYLLGGLLLGWSLGANDAANIFGTAVATKMVKFRKAALIASIFVILGAVLEGSGTSETLDSLGSIDKLSTAFIVSLSSALTVSAMTKLSLPVSTSQAVIGAILGQNLFAGFQTDLKLLTNIILSWILCPIIAAFFAILLYYALKYLITNSKIHLLSLDALTRFGLIVAGSLGAYSLGANNIGNVVGVFMTSNPFIDISIGNIININSTQQLLLIGGIAISLGIITYSYRVMKTIGNDIFILSPITALIVVTSHSLVLYLFASEGLRNTLISLNIPPLPLVPVSSSQAVIGAIIGIAVAKGSRSIKISTLAKISSGWITTPIISGIISWSFFYLISHF